MNYNLDEQEDEESSFSDEDENNQDASQKDAGKSDKQSRPSEKYFQN